MKILPIRDLKNTVEIEKQCAEEGLVFITKNGYGRLVVMDIDYYEDVFQKVVEAKLVNEGLADLKNGRFKDGPVVMSSLRGK